jgi:hypothetical protein
MYPVILDVTDRNKALDWKSDYLDVCTSPASHKWKHDSKRTVVGANLSVWRPLQVNGKGIRGWEGQQHVLSILQILFPRRNTLQLAVPVPMSEKALGYTVDAFFLYPKASGVDKT